MPSSEAINLPIFSQPERIQGSDYSVKSDVWSLGITLIELAHGCFPFSDTEVDFDEDELDATDRGPGAGLKEMSLNSGNGFLPLAVGYGMVSFIFG